MGYIYIYVIVPSRIQECSMFPRYVEMIWEEQSSPKSMLSVMSLQRSHCWWIKDMSLKHHHFPVSSCHVGVAPGCLLWLWALIEGGQSQHHSRQSGVTNAAPMGCQRKAERKRWQCRAQFTQIRSVQGVTWLFPTFLDLVYMAKHHFSPPICGEYVFYFCPSILCKSNLLQLCAVIFENIKVLPRSKV